MSRKNANFPILLMVVAMVAVTAQWTRQSGEKPEWKALRQDLTASLASLWQQTGHQVEVLAAGEGLDVRGGRARTPLRRKGSGA